jgi:hypothetical protein
MNIILIYIYLSFLIILTSYFLFYLPGSVINKRLLKNDSNFLISIISGYSLFCILSYFIFLLNLQIKTSIYFLIFFYFTVLLIFKNSIILFNKDFLNHFKKKNYLIYITLLSLLFFLFSNFFINLSHTGSDMWSFMSIIRSYLDDGYFSNISPWFDSVQSAYPSNSFLLYLTLIKFLSLDAISIIDVFNLSSIFLIVISMVVNIFVLNYFIKNIPKSISIVFLIFSLSSVSGTGLINLMIDYPSYPKIFSALIYIPTFIYIFFSNIYKKNFFPIVLFMIFLSFINHSSLNLVLLSILVLGFILVDIKIKIIVNKIWKIIIPFLVTIFFVYFYLLDFYQTPSGTLSTFTSDLTLNKSLSKVFSYYIYDPEKFFLFYLEFYLFLLAIIILSFKDIAKNKIFKYHLTLAVISILIIFNPLSIYLINKFMPLDFLDRINFIFSNYLLMGILIFLYLNKFKFKETVYVSFFFLSISINLLLFSHNFTNYDKNQIENFKDFEIFLNKNVKQNSFVISDKYSSTKILSFRKLKILISGEGFLTAATPKENFKIYERLYDKKNNIKESLTEEYLRLIGTNYFIINKKYSKNFQQVIQTGGMKTVFENDIYIIFKIL